LRLGGFSELGGASELLSADTRPLGTVVLVPSFVPSKFPNAEDARFLSCHQTLKQHYETEAPYPWFY
jgi:hypothetical protein